jgi:tetratricopeptide (TPR) repeat protein
MLKQPPSTALDDEELLHLAMEASGKQRHGDAIEYLKQAVAKTATNVNAHFLLGAEHAQIGMVERAIEDFSEALKLRPDLVPARFQLGLLFLCNARVQEALDAWKPLEKAGAADPYAVFARGLTKLARDEFAASAEDLKRGLEINRVNPALNVDMKRVLDQVETHMKGGGPAQPPGQPAAQPGQLLLSAYTKPLN